MNAIEKLKEMIRRHEGLRLKPYQCTEGRWTVGYGHNLESHNETIPEYITLQEAEDYFEKDLAEAMNACSLVVPGWDLLDDIRQAVLIDMAYNLGRAGLKNFVNMLAAIVEEDWKLAAIAMLNSRWAFQVGKRAIELSRMMESGEWALKNKKI
jgi:lysozyme